MRVAQADAGALVAPFTVSAVPSAERLLVLPVLRGHWIPDGAPEIVVRHAHAQEQPQLAVGSRVDLVIGGRTAHGPLSASSHLTIPQAEGLLIAIMSWLIAIPLSLPVSVLLARAFGRIMIPVIPTLVSQAIAVSIWLAVVIVVSLIACAWPAARATRIPTVAAIAYE